MALLQNDISVYDLIRITNGGLEIADFVQIREALTKRYKEVYGSDIDVSTATADGVFINDLSLIINNILQGIRTMYANLDVNSASGVYLDNLCRLSNVVRKQATHSFAYITLKNLGTSDIIINASSSAEGTTFIDKAGNEWLYNGESIIVEPFSSTGSTVSIKVEAKEAGEVRANAGWIYQTIESQLLEVTQPEDAILGTLQETDSQLRARRAQSVGASGTTVLESLVGELLSIGSIEDVKIYNNNTNSSSADTKDGTTIPAHAVYIILRRIEKLYLDNDDENGTGSSTIGSTIYQKLTPGVQTTLTGDSSGKSKTYEYYPKLFGQQEIQLLNQQVRWKEAVPIAPEIRITLYTLQYFDEAYFDSIIPNVIKYLNSIRLSENIQKNNVLTEAIYSDPQFKGAPTYIVYNVTDDTGTTFGIDDEITNPDTYFKYIYTSAQIGESSPTNSYVIKNANVGVYGSYTIVLRGE